MSVEVNVDTGRARGLPHFLAALFGHSERSALMPAERTKYGANQTSLAARVIFATLMQASDTTVADVA
jgi:hypothetical protein